MSVFDNAVEHFKTKLLEEPTPIDVPEWGCTIYYKPMTLKLKGILNKYSENPFEYAVRALIARALDENGELIFKPAHFTDMMRKFDPEVVERIVLSMATDGDSVEEIEKN